MDFIKLFPLPESASAHGYHVDMVIYLIHILMGVLFVGWGIFFVTALVKFHRRRHPRADYSGLKTPFSKYAEVGVVVFEAVLLLGFSIPFWADYVNALPNRKDIVEIRVVAEQFAWNVHYPGADGIFGKSDLSFFDKQSNPLGLDPNDPAAEDDVVTINQLHLPIGRPAKIALSSKDVVHSFSVPVMRVKQDVIPGMRIPVWFTPTKSGKFEIACAQLCGLGHYRMKGFLTVHRQGEYESWLEKQQTFGGAGEDEESYDDFWN